MGDFERLVVLRLGRAQKTRGPGATVVLPCIDTYTKVDLRVNAFNVPPMQIITFDRGLVELGATVFSQVKVNHLFTSSYLSLEGEKMKTEKIMPNLENYAEIQSPID